MTRYELCGSVEQSLRSVAEVVGATLAIEFIERDSDYLGGVYLRADVGGGAEVRVQHNLEDDDGHLLEPEFPAYSTLVYVNRCSDELADALVGAPTLQHLRSEAV